MIDLIIRSKTKRELLHLFVTHPEGKFYLREIQRLIGGSVGALQRQIKKLERNLFLKSDRLGPLKYYSLNKNHPYFPELQSLILKDQRKRLLGKNLRRILKIMKEEYRPDKVILYGSLASGQIRPDSDLDLLIVKKNVPPRYWDRIREVSPLLADRDVGLDYTVWTPEELEQDKENRFLREEIFKKGKVVYERTT